MAKTISTAGLSREAKHYQPGLRALPLYLLGPALEKWGINLMEVENEDIVVNFLRKAGLWRPYVRGTVEYINQLAKIEEESLTLDMGYVATREHIDNYTDKKVLNNVSLAGSGYLAKKKQPLQEMIIGQIVTSATEDLIPAIWFAKRDNADKSPMGLFDGFHEKIDAKITAGDISTSNGNLIPTGAIIDPSTAGKETEAIDQLVAFTDALSPFLQGTAYLYMSRGTLRKAKDALNNRWKHKDIKFGDVLEYINETCDANIQGIKTHVAQGSGDRIKAIVPGNLDFGMNTKTDKDFVQIRDIYEDPNEFQYWMQAKFGTRIRSIHPKVFAVNDQVSTPPSKFAGDY